jgi:hypothetical protein
MAFDNSRLFPAPVREAKETYLPDAPHNVGLPSLTFWRPGLKPEHTDKKTGLETQPSTFEWDERASYGRGMTGDPSKPKVKSGADTIRRQVEALRAAREYGFDLPSEVMDPKYLAAMVIKEGRDDIGNGGGIFNTNNKQAVSIYNKLAPRFGHEPAAFAASVYDKGQVARRLEIPFPMAWNGTGTVKDEQGKIWASGKSYAERFPQFLKAAEHPKNSQLVNFIDQHLNGKDYSTPLPKAMKDDIESTYGERKRTAYTTTKEKLKAAPLRELQYTFLGGADRMLGVPQEYDPEAMEATVTAPNYEDLRKKIAPTYKTGGSIENTTHDRKLI